MQIKNSCWKKDGHNEWKCKERNMPDRLVSQPYVVFIGKRDPNVDYFAVHPPEHPVKGDYDYGKKGYQVKFGQFAGPSRHLGFFKNETDATKKAKKFMKTHENVRKLNKVKLYSFAD